MKIVLDIHGGFRITTDSTTVELLEGEKCFEIPPLEDNTFVLLNVNAYDESFAHLILEYEKRGFSGTYWYEATKADLLAENIE